MRRCRLADPGRCRNILVIFAECSLTERCTSRSARPDLDLDRWLLRLSGAVQLTYRAPPAGERLGVVWLRRFFRARHNLQRGLHELLAL